MGNLEEQSIKRMRIVIFRLIYFNSCNTHLVWPVFVQWNSLQQQRDNNSMTEHTSQIKGGARILRKELMAE